MRADLVKRLRAPKMRMSPKLRGEMADYIEALQAELERVVTENSRTIKACYTENDRLRRTLDQIKTLPRDDPYAMRYIAIKATGEQDGS